MKISRIKVNSFCCLHLLLSVAVAFLGAQCNLISLVNITATCLQQG